MATVYLSTEHERADQFSQNCASAEQGSWHDSSFYECKARYKCKHQKLSAFVLKQHRASMWTQNRSSTQVSMPIWQITLGIWLIPTHVLLKQAHYKRPENGQTDIWTWLLLPNAFGIRENHYNSTCLAGCAWYRISLTANPLWIRLITNTLSKNKLIYGHHFWLPMHLVSEGITVAIPVWQVVLGIRLVPPHPLVNQAHHKHLCARTAPRQNVHAPCYISDNFLHRLLAFIVFHQLQTKHTMLEMALMIYSNLFLSGHSTLVVVQMIAAHEWYHLLCLTY